MNFKCFILMLFVLFLTMSIVSANEMGDVNITSLSEESPIEIVDDDGINLEEDMILQTNYMEDDISEINYSEDYLNLLQENNSNDDVIVVSNWDELQYYCSQTDRDYTLKLKENTNFYPTNPDEPNYQIKIKNNVKIIGMEGSWFGDSSPNASEIHFVSIIVEDNNKVGITLENITFKWIKCSYSYAPNPVDGMFIKMAGKNKNIIKNCQFHDIVSQYGHSTIVYLKKGSATLENCSFINCTTNYGCVSVYDPNSVVSTNMIVRNCYFENNFAETEPGCINNCGKLTVYNTTFVKNRSFWWAGAIHTHTKANTTIYDSKFIDNVAGWNGGALYTYSYLQVYNSIFIGNNCTTNSGGGAIGACVNGGDPHIYIENCLFRSNNNNCWSTDELSNDLGYGGAIALMDKGSIRVFNSTFIANSAAYGTAISAFDVSAYGSPDVIIVNNSFINHTRYGDVFHIKVNGTILNVSDNYYLGNSIEFSNLTLTKLNEGKEQATLKITATLSNPTYYDEDILDKTLYDVYINNKYVKTVNSTVFSIDFGDLDICDVYVIPTISNRKSNEVTATSTREYVFVSKCNGNDNNNGISRSLPVSSIKRALELAGNYQNIILLDGDYSETNIQIDYSVTIKGEGNATLTGATSIVSNSNLTLKNLKINNLNTDTFIRQNTGNLLISHCILTNNEALLVQNNAFTTIVDSILLNNSNILQGNNADLDYNWWGGSLPDLNINKYVTLNLTSNLNALENNQKANVKAVFYLNDGSKYANLPDINLDITVINGVVSQNTTNIDSVVVYTLTAFSDGVLTVSYNNINVSKTFEFLKSNPNISLITNDVMFGENVTVSVATPSDAEGNLTVSVGNSSQTKVIESPMSTFTFENLKADTYTITLTYTGDKKYLSKDLTSTVNVNKYESTTRLNLSAVNVGQDVIITITTIDSSTGNVTLSINNNSTTLTLTDSKANYTIKNIKRGDYLINAVYNGDDKYLTSQDSKFIEVDNLNATMDIKASDITYGELAIIKITLNSDATGNVIVTIDGVSNQSTLTNGKAEVSFTNLEAGSNKNISVFYYGDDTYFNLTDYSTFSIAKADLTFNISSCDIRIGQFAEIIINVAQKTSGTFTINQDVINIPLSGEVSYIIADLEIGNYTYTATYNGNNYNTVSKSTSFTVSEYPIPQVPNEGINTQNTHKSPYESLTNGEIAFTIPFNDTLSGDLVIDSLGNVYLTTQNGIYAFNQTGQLWYFTSSAASGNLSGIAIGRDVIIAPKSGDTLYFINQTTGERYGSSNIYQGSSLFAPVVDANATLYIVSEYQYSSEDYKLTIIPYKLWENGGDPTLVTIGNAQPLSAPTLNENIIVIVSDNRLRIIDAKTLQTISIKSGSYMPIRPVIGEGNIVYTVLSDSIVAYNSNGVQLWKTKVTGKVGSILTIDPEQAVYHVNAKKFLYRYDVADGSESKVSNLKVTSGLLIGSDGTLYFGSNNMFYALDSNGNILWRSDLNAKIIGNPVMDESGLIYVPTENGIVALTYADLKDPDLKIQVDDIVEGQTATVTITWNNQATGIITCNVNGEEITANADDLKITKVTSALSTGYYDVEASYSGDMRFKATTITKTFVVRSTDDVANNIQFDGNSTFSFALNNAQGNLTVNVAGKSYTKALVNGQTSITIDKLSPGEYEAVVIYSGDRQFNGANRTFSIEIPKFGIELNESITTENIITRISVALPADATGNLTLSVGTKKYTETVTNGNAVIIVDDLPEGNYTATLTYSGDNNYESVSKTVSINPAKIKVTLDDSNVIVKSGTTPKVSVKLADNATGTFTVSIDDGDYSADISEELIISNLEPGNYTGTVTYSGDFRYSKASKAIAFEVPKIIIGLNETVITENVVSTVSVSLPADASGELTVSVGSNRYADAARNGIARVIIDDLGEGNYTAVISYSNDAKYESVTKTIELNHTRIPVELNLDILSPCETPEVSLTLNSSATGSLTVNVGGSEFSKDLTNGAAIVKLTGLNPGNYSAVVTYSGDFRYAKAIRTISVEVPRITLDLNDSIYVSQTSDGVLVEVSMPSDASGDIDIQVNGKTYNGSLSNGFISIDINNLDPGNYTAYLTYSGDSKYAQSVKTISFEVPKIILQLNDSNVIVSKITEGILINVTLPSDAGGNIRVSCDGKNYTNKLTDGVSSVKITGLNAGNWKATLTYTGNDKYEPVSKIIQFAVDMIEISFNDTTLSVVSPSPEPVVNVQFDIDVTGNITVTVNNKEFHKELTDGRVSVVVTGLNPGNYSANVAYSGDVKYGATEKTIGLEVPKSTTTLDNIVVKSNITVPVISVMLPSDAGGNLIVNITGNVYTGKIVKGNCSVEITGLNPGNYTALVSYSGDRNYTDAHKTVNLEVPKVIISLNDNNCMWNASQIAVSINNATGTLTVEIANKTYAKELVDGSAVVDINLTPGSYDVKIIYSGDSFYAGAEKVITLEIPKIKVNLDDGLTVDSTNVDIALPSDATGNITVVVSGKSYTKQLVNGKATVDVSGLYPGSYNATVIYSGDSKYDSATKIVGIDVPKIVIELNDDTLVIDSHNASSSVSIILPEDATGTLTVTVDGKNYTGDLVDGKATVSVEGLAPGSYNATVIYSGDSKYVSATRIVGIDVPKIVIELNDDTLVIDSRNASSSVSINLPEDATGTLTVTVDGKNYTETLVNGRATVNIQDLSDGAHNITVTYSGDSKYEPMTKTCVVNITNATGNSTVIDDNSTNVTGDNSTNATVDKVDPVLVVSVADVSVGDGAIVNVRTSVESGKLVVNVNNKDYELVITNGESSLTVLDLAAGNYDVLVRFAGDDKFNEAANSTAFKVSKVILPVTDETIRIPEGNSTECGISLPEDATGTLTVTVEGKNYTETLTKGKATVNIPELGEGLHNITFTYSGDGKYEAIAKSCIVNGTVIDNSTNDTGDNGTVIDKNNVSLVVYADGIAVGDNVVIDGKTTVIAVDLPIDATGGVQLTLDGRVIDNAEIVNGTVKFTLDNLTSGNHTISMAYSGDEKYAPISKDATIICKEKTKKEAVIIVVDKFTRVANDYSAGERGNFFYAVLQDLDGNPLVNKTVQIAVNGPIYDVQTDELGRAGLQINLAAANTYTYALFFAGDSEYSATPLASSKLVLTKKSTSIAASAKAFKAKAKTKTVSVTLKTIKSARDGKAYLKAGKKVTLKVGGKTYTAKTNSKGVAKFAIKLTKKGKYTAKIAFAGDKTYKACSKSIKITIK